MSMPMRIYTQQMLAPVIVLSALAAQGSQTDDTTHSSLRRTLTVFPERIAHIIHQAVDRFCIVERRTMAVTSTASSRDIFGCSKNRQNRIVENSTYPLDDFGFR